jgi:hypothetical protein
MKKIAFALMLIAVFVPQAEAARRRAVNARRCPAMTEANLFVNYVGTASGCARYRGLCMPGEPVQFQVGTFAYSLGCDSHAVSWNFGDGSVAINQGEAILHVFTGGGVKTITATVTNRYQTFTIDTNIYMVGFDPPPPPPPQ